MKKYEIKIEEILSTIIEIESETREEAEEKAKAMYENEEIILTSDDITGYDIFTISEKKLQANKYETIVLINPNSKINEIENITNYIKENTQNIENIENLGIRKLAYNIKENNSAYYLKINFTGFKKNIENLENYYRKNDNILKFITIKIED